MENIIKLSIVGAVFGAILNVNCMTSIEDSNQTEIAKELQEICGDTQKIINDWMTTSDQYSRMRPVFLDLIDKIEKTYEQFNLQLGGFDITVFKHLREDIFDPHRYWSNSPVD
ncbi:MAG: hypothetical protein LBO02_03260 [Holosporaceae bacterium]|nr:hypothetical protein [Holosporaceae bacterium]